MQPIQGCSVTCGVSSKQHLDPQKNKSHQSHSSHQSHHQSSTSTSKSQHKSSRSSDTAAESHQSHPCSKSHPAVRWWPDASCLHYHPNDAPSVLLKTAFRTSGIPLYTGSKKPVCRLNSSEAISSHSISSHHNGRNTDSSAQRNSTSTNRRANTASPSCKFFSEF